jgi:hypothetical protein
MKKIALVFLTILFLLCGGRAFAIFPQPLHVEGECDKYLANPSGYFILTLKEPKVYVNLDKKSIKVDPYTIYDPAHPYKYDGFKAYCGSYDSQLPPIMKNFGPDAGEFNIPPSRYEYCMIEAFVTDIEGKEFVTNSAIVRYIYTSGENPIYNELRVTKNGTGSGTITSSPSGISCGNECSKTYDTEVNVTLAAAPASGSTFIKWGGACSGSKTSCTVAMNSSADPIGVTATFDLVSDPVELKVKKSGTGSGIVESSPPGINCGDDCSSTYNPGVEVTLTAAPGVSSTLKWGGACSGTGPFCKVLMDTTPKEVTITFDINPEVIYSPKDPNLKSGYAVFTYPTTSNPGKDMEKKQPNEQSLEYPRSVTIFPAPKVSVNTDQKVRETENNLSVRKREVIYVYEKGGVTFVTNIK